MKKIKGFSWTRPLIGVTLCVFMFSFSPWPGAHYYKVYLDSKLVLEKYISFKEDAPKLHLNTADNVHQMIVRYNECGRTVSGRRLSVKDGNNKILKEWQFEGASTGLEGSMTCNVKDIIALKAKSNSLKMYYASSDFPQGYAIAELVIDGEVKTASR